MHMRNLMAAVLVCLLAACSGAKTPPQTAGIPTSIPGVPQAPTWTPAVSATVSTGIIVPFPDRVTTAELEMRLDPFASPDCQLPCYNGLNPGQGGLQEALDFYARLGVGAFDMQPGDYEAAKDGTGNLGVVLMRSSDVQQAIEAGFAPPRVDLQLNGNLIRSVYMKWDTPPSYITLPRVLEVMGQPDQLELGLIFGDSSSSFVVQLIYAARQTGFAFLGEAPNDGSQLLVCPSNDRLSSTLLGIFAPDEPPMAGLAHEQYLLLPIQDTLGLPYADFQAQVGAGGCLSIPAAMWPLWQTAGSN